MNTSPDGLQPDVPRQGNVFALSDITAAGQVQNLYIQAPPDVLILSEAKLELTMREHVDAMHEDRKWEIPLAVFVSIGASLATSQSHALFGFSAERVGAFLFFVCVLAAGSAFYYSVKAVGRAKRRNWGSPVTALISDLKSDSAKVSNPIGPDKV